MPVAKSTSRANSGRNSGPFFEAIRRALAPVATYSDCEGAVGIARKVLRIKDEGDLVKAYGKRDDYDIAKRI